MVKSGHSRWSSMVFTAVIWLVEPDEPCLMKNNHARSWFSEILERYENHRGIKLTVPNANNDIKWFLKGVQFIFICTLWFTLKPNDTFSSFFDKTYSKSYFWKLNFRKTRIGICIDEGHGCWQEVWMTPNKVAIIALSPTFRDPQISKR